MDDFDYESEIASLVQLRTKALRTIQSALEVGVKIDEQNFILEVLAMLETIVASIPE